MHNRRTALIKFFILSFCVIFPIQLLAQDSPFTGADVLLIVDQSGSMGGDAFGMVDRLGTDPDGIRFEVGQFAMDWLGELANVEISESGTIRMSVIYFGDPYIDTVLDWTSLAPIGGDWDGQRTDLNFQLSLANFGYTNFGYTNFEQAFEQARDQFDRLPTLETPQRNTRVVIVVTDGEPCAQRDATPGIGCENLGVNRDQLNRVNALVGRFFPSSDYRTYIVGLETAAETYWDDYEDLWFEVLREPNIPPRAARVDTPEEMRTAVSDFLQDIRTLLSRTSVTVACPLTGGVCRAEIPPYTGLARFRIFKSEPGLGATNITITSPDGNAFTRGSTGVTVDGVPTSIETWSVQRPAYGFWELRVEGSVENVEVEIDQNFVSAELLFDDPPIYYQWQAIPIAPFLYYNLDGRLPLVFAPGFPINVTATLTDPTGLVNSISIPVGSNPFCAPEAQYCASMVTHETGDYTIGIVGEVPGVRSPITGVEPFIPVDTRTAGRLQTFTIRPSHVTVELDPLLQSQGGNWLATDGAEFCVIINDPSRGGAPLPNVNMLRVEAALLRQTDGAIQQVDLPIANDGRCSFRGLVAPAEAGDYAISVRGFMTSATGEQMVFNEPQALVMHTAPVNYIRLQLEEPQVIDNAPVQSSVIEPQPFFAGNPLNLLVKAIGSDGQSVDLSALVGTPLNPDPNPITLTVKDSQNNDITGGNSFTTSASTVYQARADYGVGSYQITIEGKPLNLRSCGCAYALDGTGQSVGGRIFAIVERVIPFEIGLWASGVLLGAALFVFGFWRLYRYLKNITENPLTGVLYFYKEYENLDNSSRDTESIGSLSLDQFKRNTKKLYPSQIPTSSKLPIKSMELTNYSTKELQRRGVRVTLVPENGKPTALTVIRGGGVQLLVEDPRTGDRYLIEKDPDAE